ncbi:helix-turn-helix domain-containing protein [Brevibacillus centrosporus]|uniref:helix-turn-helix domain-containing protein n=1 Tax=Brevibacillus centrosporus TaxID=54910 RepID=UPI000B88DB3F|nr:helix-turn-helix transcriptional regulator [Brevibacillus centrosporus]
MSKLRLEMNEENKEEIIDRYLKNFKDNLYRLQGDMSAEKFAEKIDMSRDFVTKGKKVDPKLSTLIKISHYLDISLDDLVGLNVKREPLSARLEVKTIMENLFMAYKAADLTLEKDDTDNGDLYLYIGDEYIKQFIKAADEIEAETMDDIRSLYTKLFGDNKLLLFSGRVVNENEFKKLLLEKYKYIHMQRAQGADEDVYSDRIVENFHKEYAEKNETEKLLEWGYMLDKTQKELVNLIMNPSLIWRDCKLFCVNGFLRNKKSHRRLYMEGRA